MILHSKFKIQAALISVIISIGSVSAQTNSDAAGRLLRDSPNPIYTAVPFLTIAPDSRAASLGDQGVATTPDEYSAHWNPGKLAQVKKDFGFAKEAVSDSSKTRTFCGTVTFENLNEISLKIPRLST